MKHCFRFLGELHKRETSYEWIIRGEELHHLSQVLRLSEGDIIEVFDGKGSYSKSKIQDIKPKKFAKAVSETIEKEKPKEKKLGLALGAIKPKTLDELLPSLVEIGVDDINLFLQEKTPKFYFSEKNKERWNKIILNACKQSKRNFIPSLFLWSKHDDLKTHLESNYQKLFMLAPGETSKLLSQDNFPPNICAIIGSESGFSIFDENFLATLDIQKISLGPHILRSFTASIAVASILQELLSQ